MSRTLYVVGNDGSGKSTFARRLARVARARGLSVRRHHYYGNVVRRSFRGAIEALVGVSARKRSGPHSPVERSGAGAPSQQHHADGERPRGGPQRLLVLIFLWVYQTAIGVEMRLRDCLSRTDLQLVDRSFVDDLVSIAETLRIDVPPALLRYSAALFPVQRLYFLSAGHEVEYSRIEDVDLSPKLHWRKGVRYEEMVRVLEARGWTRRICTAPRVGRPHPRSTPARRAP